MSETTSRAAMTDLISDLCDKHGLRAFRDQIAAVIRPATDIFLTPSSMDEIAMGESRFGGLPDLPTNDRGVCWRGTHWPEVDGHSPEFLAQLDLKQLHAFEACAQLPATGCLLFFFQNSEKSGATGRLGGFRVLYTNEEKLHRPSEGWEMPENLQYRPAKLKFCDSWKLPYPGHSAIQKLAMGQELVDRYNELYRYWRGFHGICMPGAARAWLFGYDDRFNCPEYPEQEPPPKLVSEVGSDGWQHLLQIADEFHLIGMRIGDLGHLNFHVHPDYMAACDFDGTYISMEST